MNNLKDIFTKYYAPLCNYAAKIINDDAMAEDIVQNLFIQLWEKKQFEKIENYDRYLLRSTRFKCIDYIRSKKTKKEFSTDNFDFNKSTPLTELKEEEIEPLIHFFASKLPPKTQRVFLLSRNDGFTYKQIAEKLDVSVKTVENQMGSALKKMRVMLKNQNFFSLIPFL